MAALLGHVHARVGSSDLFDNGEDGWSRRPSRPPTCPRRHPLQDDPTDTRARWHPGVGLALFVLLFSVSAVPLGLLAWWDVSTYEAHAEEQADRRLRDLAHNLSEVTFRYLEDQRRMVTLARLAVEREPAWSQAALQSLFDVEVDAARSLSGLYLVRPDGVAIVHGPSVRSDGSRTHAGTDYSSQDYFQAHKETDSIAWSPARIGAQSKRPQVMVAMGARSEATGDEAVLVGGIDLAALAAGVLASHPDDAARMLIVDHEGSVVVDSSERLAFGSSAAAPHPFRPSCPPLVEPLVDEEGEPLRTACSQVPLGSNLWAVWVVEPRSAVSGGLASARTQSLVALLVVLLVVGAMALGVSALLRGYFDRLHHYVDRLGEGALDFELPASGPLTPRELVLFRAATRSMLDRMRANDAQSARLVDELEQANRRLRPLAAAWAQIGEAVEILDHEGRILFANPACIEVLGDAATTTGQLSTIWQGERGLRIASAFKRRSRWTGEVTAEGPGGRRLQAVTASPVFEGDQLERVVVIRWDITDLRTAEMMAAHSERLANLGTLAAGLAHEINNPLTYIQMHLKQLQEHVVAQGEQELSRAAAEAVEGANLIQEVVQEILLVARGRDQSGLGADRALVSAQQVIDSAVTLARARLRDRASIAVSVTGAPRMRVRVSELVQVLVNLIMNAGLAYPTGGDRGVVEVHARVEPGPDASVVVIDVRDSGVGMTPQELRQAFDPFYTTRRVGEGSGLGLPLARSIVDAHGGTVSAQSAKGLGSVFTVRLPASRPESRSDSPMLRLVSDAPLEVLVVDDDRRVARVIARALSSHRVTVAIGGMAALDELEAGRFDAVLSDVMMPDLDGPGLFEQVAAQWPELTERFAFITGAPRGSAVERAVKEAGRPVFHKPFQAHLIEAWLATIEAR